MLEALLFATIVAAVAFDFTNGFHDTANAIATSVSTRALSPGQAVALAAVFNLLGEVDYVVQGGGEGEDVLPLDRRDEGLVDQLVDGVRDVVRLVLEVPQARVPGPALEEALAELDERVMDQLALFGEEVVEPALL